MDESQEKLFKELMATDFTAGDLHLYLNTHPYDQRALMIYINVVQRGKLLRDYYERMYGPLTAASSNTFPWPWIRSPWPWEWQ
jgi:spore coat protein JB